MKNKLILIIDNQYFVALLNKISVIFMGLITAALINRMLGPELKGEYSYLTSVVTILVYIFSFGLGQTYSSYRKKKGNQYLVVFTTLSLIHFIIVIILSICTLPLSKRIFLILLMTATSSLKFNLLYFAAIENVKKRDLCNIFVKLLYSTAILIIFLLSNNSIELIVCAYIFEDILSIAFAVKFHHFKFKLNFKKTVEFVTLYKLAFKSMIMLLLISLNYQLDIIFLNEMSTSYSTGIYSVAVSLANMLWLIPDAFKDVVLHKSSVGSNSKYIFKLIKWCIFISIIVIIGFLVVGKNFIVFMYGAEYADAYNITCILFLGTFSMVIYKIIHPYFISLGKQNMVLKILGISVILNIFFNFLLIPKYDMIGASLASCVSYNVCGLFFWKKFKKDQKLNMEEKFK